MFKDELGGKIMTEFCALRAKAYSFLIDEYTDDDHEKNNIVNKKAKGTKKCVIEREREKERERDRERDRERQRERARDRQTDRQRDRQTERDRQRETERETERDRERQTDLI